MSLPKEPRQKMINIMYLVLTALLALNVSSEILNAFKTVRRSLENTNATVSQSTGTILKSLEDAKTQPATAVRANIWAPVAENVQKISEDLYNHIEDLKAQIIKEAGGDIKDPTKSFNEDNLDIVTRIMINKKEGDKLKTMLEAYSNQIRSTNTTLDSIYKGVSFVDVSNPPGQDGKKKDWDVAYFHMVPTVAGLTILSKFQNDIRTAENKVVAECHKQVGEVKIIFDAYSPIVGQNSTYLLPGQNIEIKAGIGAYSKAAAPTISIGGSNAPLIPDSGFARSSLPGGAMGSHTVPVTISYSNQITGKQETLTYNVQYTVGQSNASIALDKMNVLYIGVDNPITIAASGGGDEKVQATISNGTLSKLGGGKYVARPASITDDCDVTVMIDGKNAGQAKFRVRTIPGAQAYVGGQPSGANIAAAAFKAQGGVGAGIKDFPFELSYDVVSFTFTCDTDEGDIISVPVSGPAFAGAVRTAINNNVKPGRLVTIDNIRVKGPDGRTTSAPSLLYYIK